MNKKKSLQVKAHSKKMSISTKTPQKIRLVISCTEDEKKYIRVLAAREDKSISDYLLAAPRAQMPKCSFPGCNGIHIPNKETEKVLKETDEGVNLESHDSLESFWRSMGIEPNAKD